MQKSVIVKLIHIGIFTLFIMLYFLFEEQSMVDSIMYHVDVNSNAAPFKTHSLLLLTALLSICCLLGRYPRNHISITLFLLYIITIAFAFLHGPVDGKGIISYVVLFCSLLAPLLIYNFSYNLAYKISQKTFDRGIALGIILLVVMYAITMKGVLINYVLDAEFRDGTVYVLMMFLPVVMTFNKKWTRRILIVLISISVLTSLKRGGFVTILLAVIAYLLTKQQVSQKSIPLVIKILISLIILLSIVGIIVYINVQTEGKIFDRFATASADGGSGRNIVYLVVLEMIGNSNLFELMFGHGWNFVLKDSPLELSAHNDYLEITYDIGIFGLFFLLFLLIHLFFITRNLYKQKSPNAPAYVASFVIFLLTSMSSHVFLYTLNISALTLFWGYIAGKEKQLSEVEVEVENHVEEVKQLLEEGTT